MMMVLIEEVHHFIICSVFKIAFAFSRLPVFCMLWIFKLECCQLLFQAQRAVNGHRVIPCLGFSKSKLRNLSVFCKLIEAKVLQSDSFEIAVDGVHDSSIVALIKNKHSIT